MYIWIWLGFQYHINNGSSIIREIHSDSVVEIPESISEFGFLYHANKGSSIDKGGTIIGAIGSIIL